MNVLVAICNKLEVGSRDSHLLPYECGCHFNVAMFIMLVGGLTLPIYDIL